MNIGIGGINESVLRNGCLALLAVGLAGVPGFAAVDEGGRPYGVEDTAHRAVAQRNGASGTHPTEVAQENGASGTHPTAVAHEDADGRTALERVLEAEAARIAMIERVTPSVVAVYGSDQRGGGSGVLFDPDGYGVSNYHVLAALLPGRQGFGGLSDGKMYELEVLGLDPIGDLGVFRLTGRDEFPFSPWGDSDAVEVGDTALAMGNPFSLTEDQSPTVTLGIVTGVGRYQWGVGGNLTYSDCIQVDAAINPGNSGGPLFNAAGEVVGINGRISVNTRGRFNVGFGYAISSKQVLRFLPGLRAGLVASHGSLQARVDEAADGTVRFTQLLPDGPADRAGIEIGDRLVAIDGQEINTANRFASVAGTYPGDWHVMIELERDGQALRTVALLEAVNPNLPRPIAPNDQANQREVRRTVEAFRGFAMKGEAEPRPLRRLEWTSRAIDPAAAEEKAAEGDAAARGSATSEDTSELVEVTGGGAARATRYDASEAWWSPADGDKRFEPTTDVRLRLHGLYLLERLYLGDLEDLCGSAVHVGGDAAWRPENGLADELQLQGGPADVAFAEPLNVAALQWTVGQNGTARLAFDQASNACVRIEVRDDLTGDAVRLYPGEYEQVEGVLVPTRIEVLGRGHGQVELRGDWKLER